MKTLKNENGRIIILVLITVLTLSAFWFVALTSMGKELQWVGGSKSDAQQFFDAEAGINAAMENFETLYNALSISNNLSVAVSTMSPTDPTSGNKVVADVTCRPIQDEDSTLAQGYGLPVQSHEFRPPAGTGAGVNTSRAMRYGINSVSGDKEIQIGVYRIVPK